MLPFSFPTNQVAEVKMTYFGQHVKLRGTIYFQATVQAFDLIRALETEKKNTFVKRKKRDYNG